MAATLVDLSTSPNPLTKPNGDFIITVDLGDAANYTVTAGTVVGGFGNRQITLGSGNNTLTLNGGTDQITAIIGNGNNTINTTGPGDNAVTLADGNNTVSMGDGANVIVAGNGDNTITTGLGTSQITVGNGIDTITTAGGGNTITVTLPATAPVIPDTINANSSNGAVGGNTLVVATAGTFNASLVDGIQTYQLANGGPNTLVLTDTNFVDLPGTPTITVDTGDSGGTVDASTVSTGHNLIVDAGTGVGLLAGGSGTNTVAFAGALSDYTVTRNLVTGDLVSVQSNLGLPNTTDTFTGLWNVLFAEPAPTDLALEPGSDSGISNSDAITNVTLPVITGSGANGDTVTLFDGSTAIGTGTVIGGSWSITAIVPLTEGNNAITATETNPESLGSAASAVLNVTLDTTALPPADLDLLPASDSGISNSDDITNVALPVITGSGTDGDTIILYAGATMIGTGAVTGGVWSITATVPLSEGTNTLRATQTDVAGNVSTASFPLDVTLLTTATPPSIVALTPATDSGISDSDAITNIPEPTITGTGEDGDTITLYDGATMIGTGVVTGGVWSIAATVPFIEGTNTLRATQTDVAGNVSTASFPFDVTLLTTAPPPSVPDLAPASDSGISGSDDITNISQPTVTGTGSDGDTVTLFDGSAVIGSGTVTDGTWSIVAAVALVEGTNVLTAQQTDVAGNVSDASSALNVILDTTVPIVTAALVPNELDTNSGGIVFSQTIAGGGDPNATVTLTEGESVVGSAQADATGAWTFDPSVLSQGAHTLVGSETDAAGNTGSTAPLTSPNMRFHVIDQTTSTAGSLYGTDYTGPVGYLQAEYAYTGSDTVVISANVANVFIHGGASQEAVQALAGSNVLQGGTSSNWLVGATGEDGGTDTFFVDNRGGQDAWDTLLNFHVGDNLTVWGFNATSGSMTFTDNQGTAGYEGETLQASLGNGTDAAARVTFAGLSSASAQLITSTGTSGGVDYLSVTRIS